jgi:sec-independent protein translocase protein TatA
MGFGGISIWQLLIILLIVVLLFGTKRLRSIGSDVGGAIKAFRRSLQEDESAASPPDAANGKNSGNADNPAAPQPRDKQP